MVEEDQGCGGKDGLCLSLHDYEGRRLDIIGGTKEENRDSGKWERDWTECKCEIIVHEKSSRLIITTYEMNYSISSFGTAVNAQC